MRHVFLAIPALTSQLHAGTFNAIVQAIPELAQEGIVVSTSVGAGQSLLPHARNALVAQFLESECTDLVFIDADVSWEPGALKRLLSHNVEFVAGVYRFKRPDEKYPINWLAKEELWADPETGLLEVATVPGGFLRMTRAAVEKMVEGFKHLAYKHHANPDLQCHALFEVPFVPLVGLMGEDFLFCDRWRQIGGKIWIDPELTLTHHDGAQAFTGSIGSWLKGDRGQAVQIAASIVEASMGGFMGHSGHNWPQDLKELDGFVSLLWRYGVKRYLEIGCRYGDTFRYVMSALGPDAYGVAVDFPGADGKEANGLPFLKRAVEDHKGHLVIGDSTSRRVIDQVRELGPFDAVFIDGDHSYEGVLADWTNYGGLAPIVAFHDIVGDCGVPLMWQRAWSEGSVVESFVSEGSKMGIGVVMRQSRAAA